MNRGFWTKLFQPGPVSGQAKFTFEELQNLYGVLQRNPVVTDFNKALVVETIRSIAEFIIWGDQNEPRIFEFFLEHNIMLYLHRVLQQPSNRTGDVAKQVLQTLSIIVQNIRSETGIYFLFSNNHINNIVELRFDFDDEEVLGYYVSFLKTISLKLNPRTVQFFFDMKQDAVTFPLYSEAIKFAHHKEGMVRAGVRTLTLNVYSVDNPEIQAFVTLPPATGYFYEVASYLAEQIKVLDRRLHTAESYGQQVLSSLDSQIAEVEDVLAYCADVLTTGSPALAPLVAHQLWVTLVGPLLLRPLMELGAAQRMSPEAGMLMGALEGSATSPDTPTVRPACALYVLERCFHIFSYAPFLHNLLLAVFGGGRGVDLAAVGASGGYAADGAVSPPRPPLASSASLRRRSMWGAILQPGRAGVLAVLASSHPHAVPAALRMLVAATNNRHVAPEVLQAVGLLPRARAGQLDGACRAGACAACRLAEHRQAVAAAAPPPPPPAMAVPASGDGPNEGPACTFVRHLAFPYMDLWDLESCRAQMSREERAAVLRSAYESACGRGASDSGGGGGGSGGAAALPVKDVAAADGPKDHLPPTDGGDDVSCAMPPPPPPPAAPSPPPLASTPPPDINLEQERPSLSGDEADRASASGKARRGSNGGDADPGSQHDSSVADEPSISGSPSIDTLSSLQVEAPSRVYSFVGGPADEPFAANVADAEAANEPAVWEDEYDRSSAQGVEAADAPEAFDDPLGSPSFKKTRELGSPTSAEAQGVRGASQPSVREEFEACSSMKVEASEVTAASLSRMADVDEILSPASSAPEADQLHEAGAGGRGSHDGLAADAVAGPTHDQAHTPHDISIDTSAEPAAPPAAAGASAVGSSLMPHAGTFVAAEGGRADGVKHTGACTTTGSAIEPAGSPPTTATAALDFLGIDASPDVVDGRGRPSPSSAQQQGPVPAPAVTDLLDLAGTSTAADGPTDIAGDAPAADVAVVNLLVPPAPPAAVPGTGVLTSAGEPPDARATSAAATSANDDDGNNAATPAHRTDGGGAADAPAQAPLPSATATEPQPPAERCPLHSDPSTSAAAPEWADALFPLLTFPLLPVTGLWHLGHLLHRLTPPLPPRADFKDALDGSARAAAAAQRGWHRQQVQAAFADAASGVLEELGHMWCEAVFPLVCLEWPLAVDGMARPVLRTSSDLLVGGPALYPKNRAKINMTNPQKLEMGLSSSAISALHTHHTVQRIVAMVQICQLLRGVAVDRQPPLVTVEDMDARLLDVNESQQCELSAGSAIPCIVSFAPGQERRVYFAVSGTALSHVDEHSEALSKGDVDPAVSAAVMHSSPAVVLADPAPTRLNAGIVLSVAPLLGCDPVVDKGVAKWLHVHVRPSVRGLLRVLRAAPAKKGGVLVAMRQLADGHWVLAFPDAERAANARTLVEHAVHKLRILYCEMLNPLLALAADL